MAIKLVRSRTGIAFSSSPTRRWIVHSSCYEVSGAASAHDRLLKPSEIASSAGGFSQEAL